MVFRRRSCHHYRGVRSRCFRRAFLENGGVPVSDWEGREGDEEGVGEGDGEVREKRRIKRGRPWNRRIPGPGFAFGCGDLFGCEDLYLAHFYTKLNH